MSTKAGAKLFFILTLFAVWLVSAHGEGYIGWDDVRARIAKSDRQLLRVIEKNFIVDAGGSATRLGNDFGEHVGQRVPPYHFDAVRKSNGDHYHLRIDESDDYQFTGRFRFVWQLREENRANR
jgi:hypothetical protein